MITYLAALHVRERIVICVNGYFQQNQFSNLVHGIATQRAVLEQQGELHQDREEAVNLTLPLTKHP